MTTRTTKETHSKYNTYLIDSIDCEGYDMTQPTTDREKINAFFAIFRDEQGYNVQRVGFQGAVVEYLQGLGGCLSIDFNNYDILERAKKYGSLSNTPTEKEEDKLLSNYWVFMANKLIKLQDKLN